MSKQNAIQSLELSYDEFAEKSPAPDWQNLGSPNNAGIASTPQAITFQGSNFCFVRSSPGALAMINSTHGGSWTTFGGSFIDSPSVAPAINMTSAVGVVGRMQSGSIMLTYVNPFAGSSTGFVQLAGNEPSFASAPVLVNNSDQRLEAFSLDSSGTMYHTYQITSQPPLAFSDWASLAKQPVAFNTSFPISAFLNAASGRLYAVAMGTDGQMYRSIQGQGGNPSGWGDFAAVGLGGTKVNFTAGPSANFSNNPQTAVYLGQNTKTGQGLGPLMFSTPDAPSNHTWNELNIGSFGVGTQAEPPVMLNNNGVVTAAWLADNATVASVTEDPGSQAFWKAAVQVGTAQGAAQFSGAMTGAFNNQNLILCQRGSNNLWSIIYTPA